MTQSGRSSHHETQSGAVETLQTRSFDRYVFAKIGCLSKGTAIVIDYYLSELTILLSATLIGILFMIYEKKTGTESEQDVQQRPKEAEETQTRIL